MATGLAHELNQPLTAISQSADTAMFSAKDKNQDEDELLDCLEDIQARTQRAGKVIRALVSRIEEAFSQDKNTRIQQENLHDVRLSFARLTEREQEVLQLLISGSSVMSSKEIARKLSISYRTVEHHRSRVLEKTQTDSMTEHIGGTRRCAYGLPDPTSGDQMPLRKI